MRFHCNITHLQNKRLQLSILFMKFWGNGFGENSLINYYAFNSLYEIQDHYAEISASHNGTVFQFSLWDSPCDILLPNWYCSIFQFSLWDSHRTQAKHAQNADTSFNSLYEIPVECRSPPHFFIVLSILFMRFLLVSSHTIGWKVFQFSLWDSGVGPNL